MDLVPYAIPFFFLAIALEAAWNRIARTGYYRANDAIYSSIQAAVTSKRGQQKGTGQIKRR